MAKGFGEWLVCFGSKNQIILICNDGPGEGQNYLSKVSMSDLKEEERQYFGLGVGMMRADWDGVWLVGNCWVFGHNGHLLALGEGDCRLLHVASGGSPKYTTPLAVHGKIGCCIPHKGKGVFYWDQDNMMYID